MRRLPFGIIGVRSRDCLEVLREVAGGSQGCFALLIEVVLKLFHAVHSKSFQGQLWSLREAPDAGMRWPALTLGQKDRKGRRK